MNSDRLMNKINRLILIEQVYYERGERQESDRVMLLLLSWSNLGTKHFIFPYQAKPRPSSMMLVRGQTFTYYNTNA